MKRRKKAELIPLGSLKHQVGEDLLILRAQHLPQLGEKVYDESSSEIGYVSDVFGPVKSFYVAVKKTSSRPITGNKLYVKKT